MDLNMTAFGGWALALAMALVVFFLLVFIPAQIMRLFLKGRERGSFRFTLQITIIFTLLGEIALYFVLDALGWRENFWTGWGYIAYSIGGFLALPLLRWMFSQPWLRLILFAVACLACQLLILTVIGLIKFLGGFFAVAFELQFVISLLILPLTWVRRKKGKPTA